MKPETYLRQINSDGGFQRNWQKLNVNMQRMNVFEVDSSLVQRSNILLGFMFTPELPIMNNAKKHKFQLVL